MIRLLAAVAAAGAVAWGGGASAAIYTTVFTGTVDSGFDGADLFGGGQLGGQAFTATFKWDSTNDVRTSTLTESMDLSGKLNTGAPPRYAVLEIGGHDYDLTRELADSLVVDVTHGDYCCNLIVSESGPNSVSENALGFTEVLDYPYQSVTDKIVSNDVGGGFIDLFDHSTFASFDITSATSAPEPGSWALMLAGVGIVGAALRRRHPAAQADISAATA